MAYVKQLNDKDNIEIYPVTVADAVYLNGTSDSVGRVLKDLEDQNTTIVFGVKDITKTLASGNVVSIEFLSNSIVETTKDKDGNKLSTKTTTFGENGISIVVE